MAERFRVVGEKERNKAQILQNFYNRATQWIHSTYPVLMPHEPVSIFATWDNADEEAAWYYGEAFGRHHVGLEINYDYVVGKTFNERLSKSDLSLRDRRIAARFDQSVAVMHELFHQKFAELTGSRLLVDESITPKKYALAAREGRSLHSLLRNLDDTTSVLDAIEEGFAIACELSVIKTKSREDHTNPVWSHLASYRAAELQAHGYDNTETHWLGTQIMHPFCQRNGIEGMIDYVMNLDLDRCESLPSTTLAEEVWQMNVPHVYRVKKPINYRSFLK